MNENNLLFNNKNNKIKIDFKFENNIKYKKLIKLKKNNSSNNLNNIKKTKNYKNYLNEFSNKFNSYANNNSNINNNLSSNNNTNFNNNYQNFQLKKSKIFNENNNKFLHYNIENDIRFKKIIKNLNRFKPKFLSNQKSTNEILFPKINNNNSNSLLIYSDIINDLSENDSFFEEKLENLKISDKKIPIKTKLTKNLIDLKNKKLTKNFSDLNTDLKNYQISNLNKDDKYLKRNLSSLNNFKLNNLNKFSNNINTKINLKKELKKTNSQQNFNFKENYKKLKIHFLKVKKKGYEILLKKILDTSNEMKKIKDSIHYEIEKNEKEFESKRKEYVKF